MAAGVLPFRGATGVELTSSILRDAPAALPPEVPMRDGARLFTAVYTPKDVSQRYPILITRTPYSVSPYGVEPDAYCARRPTRSR